MKKEFKDNGDKIIKTFEDFGIKMKIKEILHGPVETFYVLKLITPTRMKELDDFYRDLTHALGTKDIEIEAPILNKPYIGVRVKNEKREFIFWKDIIKNKKFQKTQKNLVLPIGRTEGEDIFLDFFENPHLVISGISSSGKSNFLLSLVASLMIKFNHKELKLILADPKRVEFSIFQDSPYLMKPIIQTTKKALSTAEELVIEMDKRYELLEDKGVRNIIEYNNKVKEKMPYIFFIIDEISDFMLDNKNNASKKIEEAIVSLLQKSRAIGINVFISTSRPCKKTLPGLLLANSFNRIAFRLITKSDSESILDCSGAEKLLCDGDSLFSDIDHYLKPRRIQTPLISDDEIKNIIT